jgi:hypothetical protein
MAEGNSYAIEQEIILTHITQEGAKANRNLDPCQSEKDQFREYLIVMAQSELGNHIAYRGKLNQELKSNGYFCITNPRKAIIKLSGAEVERMSPEELVEGQLVINSHGIMPESDRKKAVYKLFKIKKPALSEKDKS